MEAARHPGMDLEADTPVNEIIPGLCDLARYYITRNEVHFAEALAAGDDERAGRMAAEAMELSGALKRQERAR